MNRYRNRLAFLFFLIMLVSLQACSSIPPLLKATGQGNLTEVNRLLARGADANTADKNGVTPLFVAAAYGTNNIARDLINHGANVNSAVASTYVYDGQTIYKGCTPLMAALAGNHSKMVDLLLQNGADVGLSDINGSGPMIIAASRCSPAVVTKLIEKGADVNAKTTQTFVYEGDPVFKGSTPLMAAIAVKRFENAAVLMAHGANVNARNSAGVDALIIAAAYADTDMVKTLLEKGATPTAKVTEDFTAKGQPVFKGATALMAAADAGNAENVKALIDAGADVNAAIENGSTALMAAAAKGHLDAVRLLVSHGADVNAKTTKSFKIGADPVPKGTIPLSGAAWNGDTAVVKYLIAHGADVNARDEEYDIDPLFLAATKGHLGAVKVLIASGADVFWETKMGSAYGTAYQNGYMQIVRYIKDARKKVKGHK